ncbi:MAG: glycosyltransferase, partial [Limisphaerales bacterium]
MDKPPCQIKIAFLASGDPCDRRYWSGTPYYMARALEKNVGEVLLLGPVRLKRRIAGKFFNRAARIFGKQYDYTNSIFMAKAFARAFARKLFGQHFDLIVAPAASTETAFLETDIPIVYTSDTTFARMVNYQPGFSNLLNRSICEGNLIEKSATGKASLLVYPTDWAARSAVSDYGADPKKVFVAPYGANFEEPPASDVVLRRTKTERCRLFFLGTHWERKGGPIAFDALLQLENLGIKAE